MNILHPIKSIEQWALQRLLKRVAEQLPVLQNAAKDYAAKLWEENKDEIAQKTAQAIKTAVAEVITRAVRKYKIGDTSKN